MSTFKETIFISLPVKDLSKSIAFYEAIGFTQNKQFPDQSVACMILSDTFSVILITHSKWREFTTRIIPDAKKTAQFGLTLTKESKIAVDNMVEKGANAGGMLDPNPIEDYSFMYGRSLEDPDGHIWEAKWMDMSAMQPGS
jgi:predicted lactoylglutathione lyase